MKNRFIYFDKKESALLGTEEISAEPKSREVFLKADYDVLSAGTELANYRQMYNTATGWNGEPKYPHRPGYSVSATVLKCGRDVTRFKEGDKALVTWSGHNAYFLKQEDALYKIPEGVDQKAAAFAHLCSFPFLGVRKLNIQLGESVMVAGLGILGLLAIQIAKLSGATPVLACDFSEERRKLALELGADYVFDPADPDFVQKIRAVTDGKGPDGVVEVTGYIPALKQALEYIAEFGRITLLGCTRVSDETVDFYRYVHLRGIQIIGCHTSTRPAFESRPGMWTEKDDYRTFFKLVKNGRLDVEKIIHQTVLPEDCASVYQDLITAKNPPVGILFDWTGSDYQD